MATVVSNLVETSERIRRLRADLLLDEAEEPGAVVLGPMSEEYYLLGLAALEQATRMMKLAAYHAMRKD